MSTTTYGQGQIQRVNDRYQAKLTRLVDHGPQTVWAMLTQPDKLPLWLAPGTIELRPGGRVRIDFPESGSSIDSQVTAIDAPWLIEYDWGSPGEPQRRLRWTLEPVDGQIQLSLTLSLPGDDDIAKSCAGWDAHLEMLLAAMEGVPVSFPFTCFQNARQIYRERAVVA